MSKIANEITIQKIEKEVVRLDNIKENPFVNRSLRKIIIRTRAEFDMVMKTGVPIYKETVKISEDCQRVTYYFMISFNDLLASAI